MPSEEIIRPWFAVQVMGRREKMTHGLLQFKGYESFLPLYQCRRHWSDRIKKLELPLFPGYLFCRLDLSHRLPVLTTPGVVGIVGTGKAPVPVSDGEIAAIQSIIDSRVPAQPWPFLHAGQRVTINYGPLQGLDGIILKLKTNYRLIVSISLLQRSVAVEIDSAWVNARSWTNSALPSVNLGLTLAADGRRFV